MSDFEEKFSTMIKAKIPLIQIISYETLRIHAALVLTSKQTGRKAYKWNQTEGLHSFDERGRIKEENADLRDPGGILEWFTEEDNNELVLLLEDFHPFINESNPHIINRLRCISRNLSGNQSFSKSIVMSQPVRQLPVELQKEVQILMMPLPDREALRQLMRAVKKQFELDDRDYNESPRLLDAALGLSSTEAMAAFAYAAVKRRSLTENEIYLIASEKEQVIRKRGHLEFYQPEQNLNDIGGLNKLKDWLSRREKAFSEDARNFGLESPRGILLLGLPGTGKSLAAKAVGNAWELPLLRLDMGKIFGSHVGQSEENMRLSLETAETLAPCILWIDEIEKGMSGMQSSGATDGGTTSRVLGTFLTWMQEKQKPVFVVATANNIAELPPELLRKGRVDEIFFVDLPDYKDRLEIIKIHLKRRNRKPFEESEMKELAELSKGFTGAELEEAVKEALYRAFDEGQDLTPDNVKSALIETTPLSRTMSEVIKSTREWAKGRAVAASDRSPEELQYQTDKETVRLPQESYNPFIKD